MRNEIEILFQTTLQQLHLHGDLLLEHPSHSKFGDFTTNIALRLAKTEHQAPMRLAQHIIDHIPAHPNIKNITAVKPGFINITLTTKAVLGHVLNIAKNTQLIIPSPALQGKKMMVEFTDPNPFKEFHIGHLYTNTVGESIARMAESVGTIVHRANYQGDVGLHVAKSIWGMRELLLRNHTTIEKIARDSLPDRIVWLGKAYAFGNTSYETDDHAKQTIQTMNFLVYQAAQQNLVKTIQWKPQIDYQSRIGDNETDRTEISTLYAIGRKWSLEYFESIYRRLGTKFDHYYFESFIGEYGIQLVREFQKKGVFVESKGAVIFPGEQYGLHTRVFINSLGLPTYEAKELGLAPEKYKDFPYDISLIITANEINDYFKVLLCALGTTNPELAAKTKHIGHGMVKLTSGKMSSRTGHVITGVSFLNETKQAALALIETSKKVTTADRDFVSEAVAIGAIKYAFLKTNIGKDVIYNEKESLTFDGDSGPYLQYTCARCHSLLRKAGKYTPVAHIPEKIAAEEELLLHTIIQYEHVIHSAAQTYQPHIVCAYLYRIASAFNAFYQVAPITTAPKTEQQFRLLLVSAVKKILHHGLTVLGIPVLEQM